METETKTHWRKNLDPRYISGEDLKNNLHGLRNEMVVCVQEMKDAPTFDQSTQKEVTKTSLWLKDMATGKVIYKPVILNVSNAKTFAKEFGSDFIEDWYNKPIVLFAQPDKRFGHVARFKHYYPPSQVTDTNAIDLLSTATSLEQLTEAWGKLTADEKKLPTVVAKKDAMKGALTK
jgi:hypothetical protein